MHVRSVGGRGDRPAVYAPPAFDRREECAGIAADRERALQSDALEGATCLLNQASFGHRTALTCAAVANPCGGQADSIA